jgi:hypothetical protein
VSYTPSEGFTLGVVMLRVCLTIGWLVVVPVVALVLCCHTVIFGLTLDISPSAAERIRPGMSLAEVERIIGGLPGDYRFAYELPSDSIFPYEPPDDYRLISVSIPVRGGKWPHRITWVTYQGEIEVIDGEYGIAPRLRTLTVLFVPPAGPQSTIQVANPRRESPGTYLSVSVFPSFSTLDFCVCVLSASRFAKVTEASAQQSL